MGFLEILIHKDLWVMISTATSLLTITIHVIPTQLSHYVFVLALFSGKAKSHIKIRTAFVNMSKGAMFTSITSILNKILTNFQIMTKVASLTIGALASTLELLTCFYFAFVMGMRACLALSTFSMNEFFTDSISC